MDLFKKILKNSLFIGFLFCVVAIMVSCSMTQNNNPLDEIQKKYGNKKFNISFVTDDPDIKDIKYSSINIPKILKSPKRPGYIFRGWFLDENYNEQYSPELLLLKMKDITLYPKWEIQILKQHGIYDITYDSYIEKIISYPEPAKKITKFKDVTTLFNKNEIYVEKNRDGRLFLKLDYDQNIILSFINQGEPFIISPSIEMGSKIKKVKEFLPLSSKKRIIYFDITDFDLKNKMYFDVLATNYFHEGITDDQLLQTRVRYKICFEIKSVDDFRQSFVDASKKLDDGVYKIRTQVYQQEKDQLSMLNNWNLQYSEIHVKNNSYKLIYKFPTYYGINYILSEENANDDVHKNKNRLSTFFNVFTYYLYKPELSKKISKNTKFIPEILEGRELKGTTIEYNSLIDENLIIFDLGDNLHSDIVAQGVISGFMEYTASIGLTNFQIRLDRSTILKTGKKTYSELNGEKFAFRETSSVYLGSYTDLNINKIAFNQKEYTSRIANFFFDENEKTYSHRIKIKPKNIHGAEILKAEKSRFVFYDYDLDYEIFDYNYKDHTLKMDSIYFHNTNGLGNRRVFYLENGISKNIGDTIDIKEIYSTKISDYKFDNVNFKIYNYNDEDITTVSENNKFIFNENVYILFTDSNHKIKSKVSIEKFVEPKIKIIEYLSKKEILESNLSESDYFIDLFEIGKIEVPNISYSWMGNSEDLFGINKYTLPSDLNDKNQIDLIKIMGFSVLNNNYLIDYFITHKRKFDLLDSYILKFEITNKFNEKILKTIEFKPVGKIKYRIIDESKNEILDSNYIFKDEDGYKKIDKNLAYLNTEKNISTLEQKYSYYEDNDKYFMNISEYIIEYSNKETIKKKIAPNYDFIQLKNEIINYSNDTNLITIDIVYKYTEDSHDVNLKISYLFNFIVDGTDSLSKILYPYYFTDTYYKFKNLNISYANKTNNIKTVNVMNLADSERADNSIGDEELGIKYLDSAKYRIEYSFNIKLDNDGEFIFNDKKEHRFTLFRIINVEDKSQQIINIKYDANGGEFQESGNVERNYLLNSLIPTLNISESGLKDREGYKFIGWALNKNYKNSEEEKIYKPGEFIRDYEHTVSLKNIILYAIWIKEIKVTFKYNTSIAGVNGVPDDVDHFIISIYSETIEINDLINSKIQVKFKNKFEFIGWKGAASGGKTVKNGKLVFSGENDIEELEAVFIPKYQVTYIVYIEGISDYQIIKYFSNKHSAEYIIPQINSNDYVFKYWVDKNEMDKPYDFYKKVESNIELVAIFEKVINE